MFLLNHTTILSHVLFHAPPGGSVRLASSNPLDYPLIDLGLFTDPFDIAAMIAAYRSAHTFYSANTWAGVVTGLAPPFTEANIQDDAFLEAQLRDNGLHASHATGTASMSPVGAQWGVVDPDLKVKKVKGLRIVDASVMVSTTVLCGGHRGEMGIFTDIYPFSFF